MSDMTKYLLKPPLFGNPQKNSKVFSCFGSYFIFLRGRKHASDDYFNTSNLVIDIDYSFCLQDINKMLSVGEIVCVLNSYTDSCGY